MDFVESYDGLMWLKIRDMRAYRLEDTENVATDQGRRGYRSERRYKSELCIYIREHILDFRYM